MASESWRTGMDGLIRVFRPNCIGANRGRSEVAAAIRPLFKRDGLPPQILDRRSGASSLPAACCSRRLGRLGGAARHRADRRPRGSGRPAARSASARLRSWVRWRCAMMTITPSLVSRLPASRISRIATSFGSDGERRTSKRSCTAVESLLTFCPPGPEARMKLSSISRSSMAMVSVTRIMAQSALTQPAGRDTASPAPCPLRPPAGRTHRRRADARR